MLKLKASGRRTDEVLLLGREGDVRHMPDLLSESFDVAIDKGIKHPFTFA